MPLEVWFLAALAAILSLVFIWAFPRLHRQEWQFLAAVPVSPGALDGRWKGMNLTYYGVLVASANVFAAALFMVLASAAGVRGLSILLLAGLTFAVCLPGAKLVARLVEKKRNTFTVSGASFVGLVAFPALVPLVRKLAGDTAMDSSQLLAALTVSFALGEGVGRLACISFGCCYGRPVSTLSRFWRRIFGLFPITFTGDTKKASYEGGLAGEPVVPVQALTCIVSCASALIGTAFFLAGEPIWAVGVCITLTQGWRFASEFLRCDHRGGGRLSAYQLLSLAAIPFGIAILAVGADMPRTDLPDVAAGLCALWNPAVILILQGLWLLIFFYMGRSTVTESSVSFSVIRENT